MAGTAIPATGVAWDTTIPDDGQPHGNAYNELRETKLAFAIRNNKEHVAFGATSAGGEHKAGSAVIYVGDALPTTKPDGVTALGASDAGRLAYDTDATYGGKMYRWSGSAWVEFMVSLAAAQTIAGVKTFSSSPIVPAPTTDLQASTKKYVDDQVDTQNMTPTSMSGGDSSNGEVTFPNGFKMKWGITSFVAGAQSFVFTDLGLTAFTTSCFQLLTTNAQNQQDVYQQNDVYAVSKTGFSVYHAQGTDNVRWFAIGY